MYVISDYQVLNQGSRYLAVLLLIFIHEEKEATGKFLIYLLDGMAGLQASKIRV